MNTNTFVAGGVVVLLAVVGLIFYTNQNTAPAANATSTPTTTNTGQTPPTQSQAGLPIVLTNSTTAPSDTTAVVTGNVTPNGAFTSYWYEYGTTVNFGSRTSNQTIGSGYAAIPAPAYITGLMKDTTYHFRLVGENQYGKVPGTQYTFRTTVGNPPPVGSAPTAGSLAASGISRTSATLNGHVTPNGAGTQYWFEYGKSANLGQTGPLVSAGNGNAAASASLSLSDLDPRVTYYFRLDAQNQFGTVNGAILNFKTVGPASASAPTATTRSVVNVATSSATMRGTVDPNGAETTYWFEYSTDSLLGSLLLKTTNQKSAGAGTSSVSIEQDLSALNPKTTYYFRLVAQNSVSTVRGDRESFKTK